MDEPPINTNNNNKYKSIIFKENIFHSDDIIEYDHIKLRRQYYKKLDIYQACSMNYLKIYCKTIKTLQKIKIVLIDKLSISKLSIFNSIFYSGLHI